MSQLIISNNENIINIFQSIFNYKVNDKIMPIRIFYDKNNEPWFVGKDIAKILEYKNTPKAIERHVDKEDKIEYNLFKEGVVNLHPMKIDHQSILINESGLYSLVMSSKKEAAKIFKRWITHEVIPSIRKTGEYKLRKENEDLKIMLQKMNDKLDLISGQNSDIKEDLNIVKNKLEIAVEDRGIFLIKKIPFFFEKWPKNKKHCKIERFVILRLGTKTSQDYNYHAIRGQTMYVDNEITAYKDSIKNTTKIIDITGPNSVNLYNHMKEQLSYCMEYTLNDFNINIPEQEFIQKVMTINDDKRNIIFENQHIMETNRII